MRPQTNEGSAVDLPYAQYSEQAQLDAMLGNCIGKVRSTIAAAATAQVAVTTGSFATGGASGNMDRTPAATAQIWTGTPGTANTTNQYTAPHAFLLTASAATSLTIASQSVGLAVTAGDCIFTNGTATAPLPMWLLNTVYIGLSTQTVAGATQANVVAGEPTIGTGGYARIVVPNILANWADATAAQPSVKATAAILSFPSSSAAWSTAATNLIQVFLCDSPTGVTVGTNVNVLAYGALTTPQAVNAASVQLQFASAALSLTLT